MRGGELRVERKTKRMSQNTKIEWATHSWNPWIGCTKVSPGCANCYAEVSTPSRVRGIAWGKGKERVRTSAAYWKQPAKWNKAAFVDDVRPRVFPSLCDWLDDEVPVAWLADFLKVIHDTPNIDWLLLTKRPENLEKRMNHVISWCHENWDSDDCPPWVTWMQDWCIDGNIPANVWIGASIENQPTADERIPELLKIPARVRFLSVEPLLGPVDIQKAINRMPWINHWMIGGGNAELHWVIVGGESGPKARPCNVAWVRDIVRQCKTAGVACFVKQLGSNSWSEGDNAEFAGGRLMTSHPKGGDHIEWPQDLQVREFPNIAGE